MVSIACCNPGRGEIGDLGFRVTGLGEDLGRVLAEARRWCRIDEAVVVDRHRQRDGLEPGELLEDSQRLEIGRAHV